MSGFRTPITRITPARLRAEGVFEVGRVPDTSVIFVSTEERVVLFHAFTVAKTFDLDARHR